MIQKFFVRIIGGCSGKQSVSASFALNVNLFIEFCDFKS